MWGTLGYRASRIRYPVGLREDPACRAGVADEVEKRTSGWGQSFCMCIVSAFPEYKFGFIAPCRWTRGGVNKGKQYSTMHVQCHLKCSKYNGQVLVPVRMQIHERPTNETTTIRNRECPKQKNVQYHDRICSKLANTGARKHRRWHPNLRRAFR